jgi:hypothetical protein
MSFRTSMGNSLKSFFEESLITAIFFSRHDYIRPGMDHKPYPLLYQQLRKRRHRVIAPRRPAIGLRLTS